MNRRGFTLVEMMTVLSVSAIVFPSVYLFLRSTDEQHQRALWDFAVADSVRSVSEELRLDSRVGQLADDKVAFLRNGPCPQVNYEVTSQRVLVRTAGNAECGPVRALSNDVIELKRVEGGVEVVFEFAYRPGQTSIRRVFIPLRGKS